MPDKGLFDIHCHIVPSVDDGASSAEEAYKMLQMDYRQGVRNIIATPHYRLQMFETPIETVEHQFLVLRQLARKVAPDLHVYLGCDFHSNMEMVEMSVPVMFLQNFREAQKQAISENVYIHCFLMVTNQL